PGDHRRSMLERVRGLDEIGREDAVLIHGPSRCMGSFVAAVCGAPGKRRFYVGRSLSSRKEKKLLFFRIVRHGLEKFTKLLAICGKPSGENHISPTLMRRGAHVSVRGGVPFAAGRVVGACRANQPVTLRVPPLLE